MTKDTGPCLADQVRRVAGEIADTAERSAAVHDEVAAAHEQLGERSRLDPAQVRRHARRDREFAAPERAVADGSRPTQACRSSG